MNTTKARKRQTNTRVHLFARSVHLQAEAAKLDAAIAANLKELGYGG